MRTRSRVATGIVSSWLCLSLAGVCFGYRSGAGNCTYPNDGWSEMGGGQPGTGGFTVTVRDAEGPITHYTPGAMYTVEISNSVSYAGFLLQSVQGAPGSPNTSGVGTFDVGEPGQYRHGPCITSASTVTQTATRATSPRKSDSFGWTAPPQGTGPVTFHVVGVISRLQWHGRLSIIATTILEGPTQVQGRTWSTIRSIYR